MGKPPLNDVDKDRQGLPASTQLEAPQDTHSDFLGGIQSSGPSSADTLLSTVSPTQYETGLVLRLSTFVDNVPS